MQNVQPLVHTYARALEAKVQAAYFWMQPDAMPLVAVEVGRKYFKVLVDHRHQRSVHAFVDRVTGDVFKPEGWAKPAKGARFNLVTGLQDILAKVDPYGSYLYLR